MITIDQLLESVDLDFEPRFVTKDEDGTVSIWEEKPERHDDFYRVDVDNFGEVAMYPKLKLSEFENKDWTECIYEVPRKTTGKIEKIKFITDFDILENYAGSQTVSASGGRELADKINELVVAVNKHADIIKQIGDWGTRKGECLWCETLTKFEPNELKGAK